jgi:hypothetical protein
MRSAENPYAGQGPVVLDVGGDMGALVVKMPVSLEGIEIEIRPGQPAADAHAHKHDHDHAHDQDHQQDHDQEHGHHQGHDHTGKSHLTHVEVLPRPTPGGFLHCAVFPCLREGRYELSERPFGEVRLGVSISGGRITQASWPMPEE